MPAARPAAYYSLACPKSGQAAAVPGASGSEPPGPPHRRRAPVRVVDEPVGHLRPGPGPGRHSRRAVAAQPSRRPGAPPSARVPGVQAGGGPAERLEGAAGAVQLAAGATTEMLAAERGAQRMRVAAHPVVDPLTRLVEDGAAELGVMGP